MPTYGYECTGCRDAFETIQKMSDPALTTCEKCGGELRKKVFPVGIAFKGSGFYVNDYASKGKEGDAPAGDAKPVEAKAADTSPAETGAAAPAETKALETKAPETKAPDAKPAETKATTPAAPAAAKE